MIEIRENGDSVFISGYVNAVERESHVLPSVKGNFIEVIKAGAFKRALERAKEIFLLFNHDESKRLGSTLEGNVRLEEDSIGLKIQSEIKDPEIIRRAKDRGFLQGFSFGFTEIKARWEKGKDGIARRMIDDLQLYEVSLLSVKPAYPSTSIFEIRSEGIHERRYSDFDFEIKRSDVDLSRYENELKLLKLKGLKI